MIIYNCLKRRQGKREEKEKMKRYNVIIRNSNGTIVYDDTFDAHSCNDAIIKAIWGDHLTIQDGDTIKVEEY